MSVSNPSPAAARPTFSLVDGGALLLLLAGIVWLVDPRGDFPLIDDWAYALPIEHWLSHGELRFTGWQSMTLATQLAWGTLFSAPFGFSFTALRCSTLAAAGVALLGQYWLTREIGGERQAARFVALALVANPVFLLLAHTFMTDVPFLALTLVSAACLVRALRSGAAAPWVAGLALATAAVLLRQVGLALPLAFCAGVALRFGFGARLWLGAVVPLVGIAAILFGYEVTVAAAGLESDLYAARSEALVLALEDLVHLRLGVLRYPAERGLQLALYTGLFAAPLSAWLGGRLLAGMDPLRRIRGFSAAAAIAALATGLLVLFAAELPIFGNLVLDFGLGTRTLSGPVPGGAPAALWPAITAVALLAALALVALLARLAVEALSDPEARSRLAAPVFLVSLVAIYFGPLAIAYGPSFDRYFLLPAALATALAAAGARTLPAAGLVWRAVAAALLALWLGFSVAGSHDYLDWNRARYTVAEWLEGSGEASDAIDAGFEFGSWRETRAALARGEQGGRVDRPGAPLAVVFEAGAGDAVLHEQATHSWLPWAPARILAVRRSPE